LFFSEISFYFVYFFSFFFFRFHSISRRLEKSNKLVDFPLCFDLSPFMSSPIPSSLVTPFAYKNNNSHSLSQSSSSSPSPCFYHLFGIVSHSGSLTSGHYVSYVRRQTKERACSSTTPSSSSAHSESCCDKSNVELLNDWYYCSDSDVRPVTVENVLKAQGYLLFYQKV
jgi:ubiquitin C-terminal hydrolase